MTAERLVFDIQQCLQNKKRIVVAIDGMSAAGKSSFSTMLKSSFGSKQCNVIHMDQFFLRPEQRTPERLDTPGGNVDFERFLLEVIKPLATRKSFSYKPFCCKTQSFKEPVVTRPVPLIIIEGVYSTSPEIVKQFKYDITVFMRVDEAMQHIRIKKRNPELYKRFINEWIPMENKYFKTYNILEKCDYLIEDLNADD